MHAEGRRAREAAGTLGVTEAELVASTCGDDARAAIHATKISFGAAAELILGLATVGVVKTQTRTAGVVLEVVGVYPSKNVVPRLGAWAFCFAVREGSKRTRTSLQIFDGHGTAVQKVFLLRESDAVAFDDLVARHAAPGSPVLSSVVPSQAGDVPSGPLISVSRLLHVLSGSGSAITVVVANGGVTHSEDVTFRRVTAKHDWLSALGRDSRAKLLLHRSTRAHVASTSCGAHSVEIFCGSQREATLERVPAAAVAAFVPHDG